MSKKKLLKDNLDQILLKSDNDSDLSNRINKVAKKLNFSRDDILYYNVEMPTANQFTAGTLYNIDNRPIQAKSNVYNNDNILKNPSDYYGSIVRMQFPGFTLPVIGPFIVQNNPVSNINLGIYSFTLQFNGINSDQTFFIYVPQNLGNSITPQNGTQYQIFSEYYFLYDYTAICNIMNTALTTALTSLKSKGGTGAIAGANAPFFDYDSNTERISLYADNVNYNQASSVNLIKIFFNAPTYIYMEGLPYNSLSYTDPNGLDNELIIYSQHLIHTFDVTVPAAYTALVVTQQYVSLGYMCDIKNITVETSMGSIKEIFNITQNNQTVGTTQSTGYNAVLTDFIMDVSAPQAGLSSYRFIYNAPSLYRVFGFNDNLPLQNINVSFWWYDTYENKYPLYILKGESPSVKFMFIKKDLLQPLVDGLNQL